MAYRAADYLKEINATNDKASQALTEGVVGARGSRKSQYHLESSPGQNQSATAKDARTDYSEKASTVNFPNPELLERCYNLVMKTIGAEMNFERKTFINCHVLKNGCSTDGAQIQGKFTDDAVCVLAAIPSCVAYRYLC